MRTEFYECEKHNSYRRKKAIMKNVLLATMIMLVGASFVSCSSDDDDDKYGFTKADVVGTWETTAVQLQGGTWIDLTSYLYHDKRAYAKFNSDGTYRGWGSLGNGSGTWELKGNTLTTYVDGQIYITYTNIVLNGDEMSGTMTDKSASMNFKARKHDYQEEVKVDAHKAIEGTWQLLKVVDFPLPINVYFISNDNYIIFNSNKTVDTKGDFSVVINGNNAKPMILPFPKYLYWSALNTYNSESGEVNTDVFAVRFNINDEYVAYIISSTETILVKFDETKIYGMAYQLKRVD